MHQGEKKHLEYYYFKKTYQEYKQKNISEFIISSYKMCPDVIPVINPPKRSCKILAYTFRRYIW